MRELLFAPMHLMKALQFTLYGITFDFWQLFLFGAGAAIVFWFVRRLTE